MHLLHTGLHYEQQYVRDLMRCELRKGRMVGREIEGDTTIRVGTEGREGGKSERHGGKRW